MRFGIRSKGEAKERFPSRVGMIRSAFLQSKGLGARGLDEANQVARLIDCEDEGYDQKNDEEFDASFDLWTGHGAGR